MGRARGRRQKYIQVNRRLGLPRRRWEDNTKIGLKNKMGWSGLDESGSEEKKWRFVVKKGNEITPH
jgi:hypothetical protein